jgi:hypothetical protein
MTKTDSFLRRNNNIMSIFTDYISRITTKNITQFVAFVSVDIYTLHYSASQSQVLWEK